MRTSGIGRVGSGCSGTYNRPSRASPRPSLCKPGLGGGVRGASAERVWRRPLLAAGSLFAASGCAAARAAAPWRMALRVAGFQIIRRSPRSPNWGAQADENSAAGLWFRSEGMRDDLVVRHGGTAVVCRTLLGTSFDTGGNVEV